jgi:WD40 repeat protein
VPFPGGETLDKLYRHRFEEPVPVEKLRPEVPGAVAGVVRKLMAKAPEQRYQRPAMLAAELAGLQRRGFGRQPPPAAPDRVSHGVGSRWWVLSGTAAAFLLVTVLIFSLGSGNPGPHSTGGIPASIVAAPANPTDVKKVPGPSSPTTGGLTFREIGKFTSHSQMILAIAFTPDGRSILTGGDDVLVRMWDFPSGKKIREFQGHASPINSIAVSPDGRRLVTASGRYAGPDWSVRLWDAATGSELKRWDSHQQMVSRAFFSPDGRRVISASWDGTVRVWDAETGQSLQTLPANPKSSINSLALFAEGNLALAGCHDRTLRRFHLSGEGEMRVWQTGHSDRILDVVVAPDGRLAATASIDRSIRLWNIEKGNEVRVLAGHEGWVFSVRFSRDGTRLLSAAGDRTIRLWDPATGRELARASHPAGGVRCAVFSPDERHILSAGDDNIVRLWQLGQ